MALMLDLNDFLLFVHIVDRGGFTAASRALDVPKSTLSHRVMKLESNLGVLLLIRSSRHVGVTDAGQDFYRHAVAMLREAEMAETVVRQRIAEPSGLVRCTAALSVMHFGLSEIIAGFLIKYPKVDILAHAKDRMVHIVGEGFDVAIGAHSDPLADSNLVQRRLVSADWYLFAGAKYLERHCEPMTPDDLNGHASLFLTRPASPSVWRLRRGSEPHEEIVHPISPRFVSDDVLGLQKAALMGLGIVALPTFVAKDAVRCGQLRRILLDWTGLDCRARQPDGTNPLPPRPSPVRSRIPRSPSCRGVEARPSLGPVTA